MDVPTDPTIPPSNDGQLTTTASAAVVKSPTRPRHVVCLGASAGGLEALEKFFGNVPPDSGLAFVVVQHLSPDFKSLMDELLARHTQLAIHRVEHGMQIEPDAIYLIPPKKEMIVTGGKLLLTDKDPSQGLSLPIDKFMRSLAQDYGEQAIGVILSGTGSDGSRGVRAVREAGGLVLAQDAESANFDGMPRAAADTGVVDAVLPPQHMPQAILEHARGVTITPEEEASAPLSDAGITHLLSALREAYGIDFSYYKPTTVSRRVERRVQLSGCGDLNEYVNSVLADPEELNSLYRDLLIGVTKFFRDADAFRQLEVDVLPQLLNQVPSDGELRIWVAGCATGEEPYSIAILVQEALAARGRTTNVKIFATDVHRASLEFASAGVYSEEALSEVSSERKRKYFQKRGSGYHVSQALRKMVVFAPHNVVKDAPFTKLDLITCRNLLIYLQPEAQKKAISLFHFGLRGGGFLFLGPSESPGDLAEEFETVDRHWKVFRKRRDARRPADLRLPLSPSLERLRSASSPPAAPSRGLPEVHLLRAYDALLDQYVPPSLLVDSRRRLVHSFAGAGKFLAVPDGRPPDDVLDYVDPELKLALAGALQRAAKEKAPVVYGSLSSPAVDGGQQLRMSVRSIAVQSTGDEYYLVSFEAQEKKRSTQPPTAAEIDFGEASRDRIAELEDELRYTKENLQATIEEMETTNEELQATNEELVASNEELQSTNEELHSVNEELYTVNAEHQRKIAELTELTDDMDNLLRSTEVGTIFVDRKLRIRKFTPQVSRTFQILDQDIGRPLDAFTHNIQHEELLEDVRRVIATNEAFELDVQDKRGAWFLLRILPYRSKERVEGAVVTLIDIDTLKRSEDQLRRLSKVFMDGADPIIIEDLDGTIVDVNAEVERVCGWSREDLIGQSVTMLIPDELVEAAWKRRRECLEDKSVRSIETTRRHRSGATHPVLLTLSLLQGEGGRPVGVASIAKDITEHKRAEEEARTAVKRRDEFLAMLSHELRNPLGAIANAAKILEHKQLPQELAAESSDVILRQSRQMARLLDDLLDVSRITQGKIDIRKQTVDLSRLAKDALQATKAEIERRGHTLEFDAPGASIWVEGDPSRLLQIVENLLVNAAKYTPHGGRIRLDVSERGGEAVIAVADNGRGIPAEVLGSVFDLFVQEEKPLDRSEGGMGVGLSLVRMLVELHGGAVTAHSEGRDKGSEFTVRLPTTQPSENQNPDGADDVAPGDRSAHVLIIEDNEDSRRMLEQLLHLDGYTVSVAADGPSGFDAIKDDAPDIALVDIGLPLMNGYDIARRVRSELTDRRVRMVALTGYGGEDDHKEVLRAGFDDHLVKPVAPDDLARVLHKAD